MTSTCSVCSAPAAHRCAGCQQVAYCGRDHQRTDWKAQHRNQCRRYKVERNEQLGRHLVATRSIKQGEIIYRDEPYAIGPKMASVPLCLGCNRNLMPLWQESRVTTARFHECTRCGWPLCGSGCEQAPQHLLECSVLAASGYRPNIRPDPATPEKRESAYCVIVPLRVLLLEKHSPDRYATVQGFESHLTERLASPLYSVLRANLVPFIRTVLGLKQYTDEMVLQVSAILDTNCYEIRLPNQHVKVRGLYPLGAMLSHDCRPNTRHYFDEQWRMVLVAAVDIPAGATIHASYTQPLLGTLHRRLALKQAKCFDCACDRCRDPTELGTNVGGFRCPHCRRQPSLIVPVDPTNNRTSWRCQNRRCSYQEPPEQYVARCERMQRELLALDRTDPAHYEAFLTRHEPNLHRWNAYILQAKYALTQLLGSARPHADKAPLEVTLRRTVELCRDLLFVADQLEPGFGCFRTKLLLELGTAFGGLRTLGILSEPERQEWESVCGELDRIAKTDPTVELGGLPRP
ncbi:SET domain-containing protein SmydA-8-like [Anopheles nili]|uniref:SET domain-containing protein SmydA-8-like n=1 Tax=Anopheles nili TaxID=185578 RepID=UPI00237A15A5|nr:SET domain-containing protein SmydA-8-like [Anopheles nili]